MLPAFTSISLDTAEELVEFEDSVKSFSYGKLSCGDVPGKHACSQCRYIISKGRDGSAPNIDGAVLSEPLDRCLLDCVLLCLDAKCHESPFLQTIPEVARQVEALSNALIKPVPSDSTVVFLPFASVYKARAQLAACDNAQSNIHRQTLESRFRPVLAAKGIHLYHLSSRLRCYTHEGSLNSAFHKMMFAQTMNSTFITIKERRDMLECVGKTFLSRRNLYWSGNWTLASEISSIPLRLWSSFVFDMCSQRKLACSEIGAKQSGTPLLKTFPFSNLQTSLPDEPLEDFLHCKNNSQSKSNTMLRSDIVLSIRVLKVVEQVVFSRTKSVTGPLTTTMSIAGILESTPSWTSVLNALGLVASHDTTERFKKKLVASREAAPRGAMEGTDLTHGLLTVQIDNYDVMPFHSVKIAGKRKPVISGTATQAILRKRRRVCTEEELSQEGKWLDPTNVCFSRGSFISNIVNPEGRGVIDAFFDIFSALPSIKGIA